MTDTGNSTPNKPEADRDFHQKREYYEDEINLIDYFLVLGRHKRLIILGSILPALLVGLALFFWPRDYKISYTYNVGMGEKGFKILEDTFYSQENLQKLIESLNNRNLTFYADKVTNSRNLENLKELISFEVSPSYFEVLNPQEAKTLEELQKIRQAKGTLLLMNVKSSRNIRQIGNVCRKNFEQIVPVYSIREEIKSKISGLKSKMANIENSRFALNQRLDRKQTTLKKMKNTMSGESFEFPNELVLQFNNAARNSQYLPLSYQIQALKTPIVNLEEKIRANEEDYEYYSKLLKLNNKIFDYLNNDTTLNTFHTFLNKTLAQYDNHTEQKDYLSAYIKRIENRMANKTPIIEEPKVFTIARGTVQKAGITFAVAFLISVFGAFLLEGLQRNKAGT